jgi:hypothetical protein
LQIVVIRKYGKKMLYRMIGLLLVAGLMSACQATSQLAGQGPLALATSSAGHLEKYFANPDSRAIAISHDGQRASWSNCAYSTCSWNKHGSAQNSALKRCEKTGNRCGIFAVYNDIVWQGEVTLPNNNSSAQKVFRMTESRNAGETTVYSGVAKPDSSGKNMALTLRYRSSYYCSGLANIDEKRWYLDCSGKPRISGRLEESFVNLYWGKVDKARIEIVIKETGWPLLEAKLASRPKLEVSYAPSVPTTTIPRGEAQFVEKSLRMNWGQDKTEFHSVATRSGDSRNGKLAFFYEEQSEICSGRFEVWYGTTGEWSMDCPEQGKLNGTLRIRGDLFTGKGQDTLGNAVSFSSKI